MILTKPDFKSQIWLYFEVHFFGVLTAYWIENLIILDYLHKFIQLGA
ncbi:hypothetical protein CAMSH0001_1141 [Campylobacter showae RM3277]|uniref:Uncharacterized protein n=1 Tax=Campylobacter showae RM3277 TaxID=553219 RepID=C6RI31_9BACT|nr:hypothetical protein CAMSH0001_1141 [Campylobacter showae RM3277]